ncbi:hypothetical protein FSP39_015648 [Pinctada imbricata]|uniref:E3 ubiquitin-protein ligase listerin n=1 Tax=Pinctada imbricata TaxID=66713 RepID=A0AA89C3P1_PINIB|nr:hypothetical protein FSP39_015648 [Pinctada imbricata]
MPGPGSKKQSQRTKGNTKPSSSSEAAKLLAEAGTAPTGFIGFGTLSTPPAYVPASEGFDDGESSLDPDFRMVLRKVMKRDSTTKVKALQEVTALFREKDEELVKGVLPFWPRNYNKLANDVDYRVREAAQQALNALAIRMKKNLAPHLKSIMGCWLLSQCDTYPTVASAAQQAFQTAFPPAKQINAISFCKSEICEYLMDNLLKQTPLTLSDPKSTEKEDMENKYNRVLTSSLLAFRKLLTSLTSEQIQDLTGQLDQLLSDPKLWKHGKSSILSVRAGMFNFLAGVCQSCPDIANQHSKKISPYILHNLDEKDPVICPAVWEAALSLVNFVENCWKDISVEKAFWPKFRNFLANGCHGNACYVAADLLPFISKVPVGILGENNRFYEEFLSYFKQGLSKDQVQSSLSELSALTKAFMECSHFILKSCVKFKESSSFAKDVFLEQVYPVVQSSLVEEKSNLSKTSLYGMMGKLSTSIDMADIMDSYVGEFWTTLSDDVTVTMETMRDKSGIFFVDRLVHFVKCLVYPDVVVKTKSDTRVKFSTIGSKVEPSIQYSGNKVELTQSTKKFVEKLVLKSFGIAYHEKRKEYLHLFASLIELHPSETMLQEVISLCNEEKQSDQSNSSYFVFEICLPWLDQSQSSEENELNPEELISVLITFIPLLEKEDVLSLLIKLTQMLKSIRSFHCLFEKVLSAHRNRPGIKQWLGSQDLAVRLSDMAKSICHKSMQDSDMSEDEIQHGWNVITLVLSADGESVPQEAVETILATVLQSLKQIRDSPEAQKMDVAVRFVSIAMQSFFYHSKDCLRLPVATELLLMLFAISIERLNISEETASLAENAWNSGIGKVVKETGGLMHDGNVLSKAVEIVKCKLKHVQSFSGYDNLYGAVKRLLSAVKENLPCTDGNPNPVVASLMQQLYVITDVSAQTLNFTMVRRDLSYLDEPRVAGSSGVSMVSAMFTALYDAHLLYSNIEGASNTKTDEDVTECALTETEKDVLLLVIQTSSVLHIWTEEDRKTSSFPDVSMTTSQVNDLLTKIFQLVSIEDQKQLLTTALDSCTSKSYLWPLSLSTMLKYLSQNVEFTLSFDSLMDRCVELTEGCIQMLQACMAHLDIGSCTALSELMVARLLSCPKDAACSANGGFGALAVLNSSLRRTAKESLPDLLKAALSQIVTWRDEDPDLLLLDCRLSDVKPSHMLINTEMAVFLNTLVCQISRELSDKDWDFILCTTVSLIQTIEMSSSSILFSPLIENFVCAITELFAAIADCIQNKLPQAITVYPPNLKTEWDEFFSDSAYSVLLLVFHELIGSDEKSDPTKSKPSTITNGCRHLVLRSMGNALRYCPKQYLLDHKLPPCLRAEELSPLPDALQSLINHLCTYLTSTESSVQLTGFNLLLRVIPEVSQHYKDKDSTESKAEENTVRSPPQGMMDVMKASSLVVHDLVQDLPLGHTLGVAPHTEENRWCLSHLLVWEIVLQLFKNAPDELRQEYAGYLREHEYLDTVMFHLLRLMPTNPTQSYFQFPEQLDPKDDILSIQQLACGVYYHTLEIMPALARQWWKDQDRKTAGHVDRFTSKYVSPMLCTGEIKSVNVNDTSLQNITIKTRPATREVIATYALEEVSIEIVITLPPNYPLGNINVTSEKKVGVSAAQWDKWLLQLNIFLQHQNGSIIDGLRIWKRNIDKRFDGVDDCMICFSVLHSTNFQLPRMVCKTCKKKFHSACLYKWFQTSHNSTCPLCRNLF